MTIMSSFCVINIQEYLQLGGKQLKSNHYDVLTESH